MMHMKGPPIHTPSPGSLFPAVQAKLSLRGHCQRGGTQGTTHVSGRWQHVQESAGESAAPPTAQDTWTGWAPAGLKAVRDPLRAPPATRWVAGGTAEPLTLGVSVSPGNTWGSGFHVPSGQRAPRRASSQNGAPARCPPSWRAGRPPGAGPRRATLPEGAARAQDKGLPGRWTESGGRGRCRWRGSGGREEKGAGEGQARPLWS